MNRKVNSLVTIERTIKSNGNHLTLDKLKQLLEEKSFDDFSLAYQKTSKVHEYFLEGYCDEKHIVEIKIEKYPNNPKYFVSILGSILKNKIQLSRNDLKQINPTDCYGKKYDSLWNCLIEARNYTPENS